MFISKKAQALTELAVFGSILLMLLGILLHYGLKYNAQQRVTQEAFRKALGVVAKNIAAGNSELSASYMVMKDENMPSPENPFGMGSVVSVGSQASVMRDHRMMDGPSAKSDLPKMYMDIGGQDFSVGSEERKYLYTAAFRDEKNIPSSYAYSNTCDCDGDGVSDETSKYGCAYGAKGTGWWILGDGICTCEKVSKTNPQTGEDELVCPEQCSTVNIRIADECEGELVNLETVNKRCNQISRMGINSPWYCDAAKKKDLFALSNTKDAAMGLQPDSTQKTKVNNILRKQESLLGITTTEIYNWQVTTDREIIYNNNIDDKGFAIGAPAPTSTTAKSSTCYGGECDPANRKSSTQIHTTSW